MNKTRILISNSDDPWFNLAVEDTIFRSMPADQRVLFLWRNADTIVIGRAQNPWRECNTERMQQDGVKLARRQTGGGAVFHDLGNTNFTFMAPKPEYDKEVSTNIVLAGLETLGIKGLANGRNDLVVEDGEMIKKFSGSAYRETSDRGFHHGTLLLDTNMQRLGDYLNPDAKKLAAKGITSVRSRVINLKQIQPTIDHQVVCEAIIAAFSSYYGEQVEPEWISPDHFHDLPGLHERFAHQSSWDWNYGSTPPFTHSLEERFDWGGVQLLLDVEKGVIKQATVYTDMLEPAPLENLAPRLQGLHYNVANVVDAVDQLKNSYPHYATWMAELSDWLSRELA
ncbi:Lipoate-protein ligase A [Marinomonas aquimarina]|uniref:lipoate--protein ligase n=1 Tax=Marinomonas aquimarina TaxID=295068 RepID=A0A1A8T0X8_9GAMM|nr:lipoate--protein ligase [Marinomonas aquimarina]SBS25242.1 Lipoate-protein ligase A [Marinomonas aquimarina]